MEILKKFVNETFAAVKYFPYNNIVDKDIYDSRNQNLSLDKRKRNKLFFKQEPQLGSIEITAEEFKDLYANQLYNVSVHRNTLLVEKSDEKVTIKIFSFSKYRQVGVHYFSKKQVVSYLTYNKKTKVVYVGSTRGKSKIVRSNSWYSGQIEGFFNQIFNSCKELSSKNTDFIDNSLMFFEVCQTFFNEVYGKEINLYNNEGKFVPIDLLLKNYVEVNQIKHPNNYKIFLTSFPNVTLRDIKRAKNNLILAVQKKNKLMGKKYHRALHELDANFNCELLNFSRMIFGETMLKSKPDEDIVAILNHPIVHYWEPNNTNNLKVFINLITNKELNRIYNCFIDTVKHHGSLPTFLDHIKFYLLLRLKYNEDITWLSDTREEFTKEHVEFSSKISKHRNGIWDRTYSPDFINMVENEIVSPQGGVYYPIVFTKQIQHYEESEIQSNCVKTYVKRIDGFIVSLREGSDDSKERATIQFNIVVNGGNLSVRRGQTLGRFNKNLEVKWDFAVEELTNHIKTHFHKFKIDDFKLIKTTEKGVKIYNTELKGTTLYFHDDDDENNVNFFSDNYNIDLEF